MGTEQAAFAYVAKAQMTPDLSMEAMAHLAIHDRELEQYLNAPRSPWTPALIGATTSPTMGTAAQVRGRYRMLGSTCEGTATFKFGTAGVNAGAGIYTMAMPVRPFGLTDADAPAILGFGSVYDSSAEDLYHFTLRWHAPGIVRFDLAGTSLATIQMAATVPWTWDVSDGIGLQFSYEVVR